MCVYGSRCERLSACWFVLFLFFVLCRSSSWPVRRFLRVLPLTSRSPEITPNPCAIHAESIRTRAEMEAKQCSEKAGSPSGSVQVCFYRLLPFYCVKMHLPKTCGIPKKPSAGDAINSLYCWKGPTVILIVLMQYYTDPIKKREPKCVTKGKM